MITESTGFFGVLPDIPRIYTALAEWMACMACILAMRRRMDKRSFLAVSVLFLIAQSALLVLTEGLEGLAWNVCMAAAVGMMFLFIWSCADVTALQGIYYCGPAFIAAELAASLEWQIYCFADGVTDLPGEVWTRLLFLGAVYAVVFTLVWRWNRHVMPSEEAAEVSRRGVLFSTLIALFVFAFSNLGFVSSSLLFAGRDSIEIFNVRTLVDLGGLAILCAYQSQWRAVHIQKELDSIQNILDSQYQQYRQAQQAVDLINYRYHDLKNHIIALRSRQDSKEQRDYLDRLEEEIQNYQAQNKTGNQVLDTLLTSKSLTCMKQSIDLTCVADGALLDFLDVMDICSIFGNALDNAIESVSKIQDKEKRLIHLTAFSKKRFLIIRIENYCEGEILFKKGMPVTTKKEKDLHGYGLKSLRYTVHKYNGEVNIEVKDSWFSLQILIPLEMKESI